MLLVIGAGCKECTRREVEYCLSNDVIEDHCCCQRKYHGLYLFIDIKNVSYLNTFGLQKCSPILRTHVMQDLEIVNLLFGIVEYLIDYWFVVVTIILDLNVSNTFL